jgi:hypothetical protein
MRNRPAITSPAAKSPPLDGVVPELLADVPTFDIVGSSSRDGDRSSLSRVMAEG